MLLAKKLLEQLIFILLLFAKCGEVKELMYAVRRRSYCHLEDTCIFSMTFSGRISVIYSHIFPLINTEHKTFYCDC